MAEFTEVMPQFARLCDSYKHCDDCPVSQAGFNCDCDHQGYSKTGAEEVEHIIMEWAAEHPAPVYPSWLEYLMNAFPDCGKAYMEGNDALWRWMWTTPIPADMAKKLGIEPKEG